MGKYKKFDERVEKVFEFIMSYQRRYHRIPSYREISEGTGIPSINTISNAVKKLTNDERLVKLEDPSRSGKFRVTGDNGDDGLVRAKVVGSAVCGVPDFIDDDSDEGHVFLPVSIFGDESMTLMRVEGYGMTKRGICPGDIAVCADREPRSGDVVLASVPGRGTICRIFTETDGKVFLRAEDGENFPDIPFNSGEGMKTLGVVGYVIHDPNFKKPLN
ncbi:MAG: hypothetical protein LUD29_03610 [Clostridia bacterium]|nr:hypothetical protein [Clostridia bacterium]